jgi:hypothetical protein
MLEMTLILTEISQFGIAMAADSAVTEEIQTLRGTHEYRVLTGVHKLQVIDKLNAGISVWGQGEITIGRDKIYTDVWLRDFIRNQEANYNSLSDFATLLQNELRNHIAPINVTLKPLGTIGFHLAGYVDYNHQHTPTFYHIHNGISQALSARRITIDPTIINANHDLPPDLAQQHLLQGRAYITRNGDFTTYAALFGHLGDFLQDMRQHGGLTIPHSRNLRERAEWLRFQITTMSELYQLSNLHLPTIGGKIDTLLITSDGIDDCGLTL